MKYIKLATLFASVSALFALSCQKEIVQKPLYPTNVGEEYIEVTVDTLSFQGRGGSLSFSVCASYDVTITTDEWITMSSVEVPGDAREYVLTATTVANKGEGAQDREGRIVINTANLKREIVVIQPFFNRPDIANPIKTAEEFKFFIEEGAPYIENAEEIALGADIDMKGVTLSKSAEYFNGVFDGNCFSIMNLTSSLPLFAKNSGVINDLVIAQSCTITVPSSTEEIFFSPFVAKNYGTVSGCVNYADIVLSGSYARTNVGAFVACNYESGVITKCVNRGEIKLSSENATGQIFIGGIAGYDYNSSSITDCESYGPITCTPTAFTSTYQTGGVVGHHNSTGALSGNIVHKEAKISTNEVSGTGKSYFGGVVGNMDLAPNTSDNQVYADLEIMLKVECYIGGLQGWQGKVDDASNPSQNVFEGSVVNTNITAYTKGKSANGNNPCNSAGLVTGRFNGQSGKATTLHYGTEDKPIKVSGSITSLQSGTSKVAAAKDYQQMLSGDGSKTSVNLGAIPECDFGNITYKVCGDGQTGDPEDLIIKVDAVKLSVAAEGGDAVFSVRGNYAMTVTPKADWLSVDITSVAGDNTFNEITVTATANPHTFAREGQIYVTMPMGSTEVVTVTQEGNMTLPESLEVSVSSVEADPAGTTASKFTVTANYETAVTADSSWIKVTPATVAGDETAHTVSVLCDKNTTGATRSGKVIVTMPKGKTVEIAVSQEKFVYVPKTEVGTVADFLDLMTYGGDASVYTPEFVVKLTADIDLKGKTFDPISNFVATLDGQGHSLKNWASAAPLFTTLTGKVANLNIDATCSTNAAVNIAYFANTNAGTIENCTNNAAIKLTVDPTAATRIAPFAAVNTGTIKACTNNAAVSCEPATMGGGVAVYLSGIVCNLNGGTVEDCVNNGKVSFAPKAITVKAYMRVGGIVSQAKASSKASVRNCVNSQSAAVSITDPSAILTDAYIAGICGEIEKLGVTVLEGCSSFGDVYVNCNKDGVRAGGIAGNVKQFSTTTTLMQGCVVNCNVTGAYKTVKTPSYNLMNSCGMVFGRLGGDAATAPLTLGSEENPVKVSGSISILASEGVEAQTVTLTEENFKNYLGGDGSGISATTGSTGQIVNAKYEVVTKK